MRPGALGPHRCVHASASAVRGWVEQGEQNTTPTAPGRMSQGAGGVPSLGGGPRLAHLCARAAAGHTCARAVRLQPQVPRPKFGPGRPETQRRRRLTPVGGPLRQRMRSAARCQRLPHQACTLCTQSPAAGQPRPPGPLPLDVTTAKLNPQRPINPAAGPELLPRHL